MGLEVVFLRPVTCGQGRFRITMLAEILHGFTGKRTVFSLCADIEPGIAFEDLQWQFLATSVGQLAVGNASRRKIVVMQLRHVIAPNSQ